jgi:asparaginyl-tRNA synthetase
MEGEGSSERHLISFFQIEIELRTESVEDVFEVAENLLAGFSNKVLHDTAAAALCTSVSRERLASLQKVPYPRLRFEEAMQKARELMPSKNLLINPHNSNDLTYEEEEALGAAYVTPYWIYSYPEGVRDSIYRRNLAGYYDTYDLMLPGKFGELSTGGLRPESYAEIKRQSALLGTEFNARYAEWKDRSGVQSGGFGIGLERLIRFASGGNSILEFRSYHDTGPNASITPIEAPPAQARR